MGDSATKVAGSLVGSVLESTGYHYQAAVLDALKAPFENEVGGLIYLVAVCLALVLMSTQGGFKMSSWLMIGPPLFFAVTQVRSQVPNARWEFSFQQRNQAKVEEVVNIERPKNQTPQANVSRLFARYIGLISEVNRYIVDTMSRGRSATDLWFLVKAQLYAQMHTAQIDDPGLSQLLHAALFNDCRDVVRKAQAVSDVTLRNNAAGGEADAAVARHRNEADQWMQATHQGAVEDFNKTYREKQHQLSPAEARYVATLLGGPKEEGAVIEQRTARLRGLTVSCADIWRWTLSGMMQDSNRKHAAIVREGSRFGIPQGVLNNLMLQASGVPLAEPIVFNTNEQRVIEPGQVETINRIISLYYLRNEITKPDRGGWISWMAGRHEVRVINVRMQGENALSERSRISVREWAEKQRLIHAAASLPYYQGIALFFLGALFPFFALLLLIPGKHTGFLMWFVLWFWIKSWDLGLTIVMLVDDVLFAMFAVERQTHGKVHQLPLDNEITSAFAALRELDPTFQLSTYYSLISVCVLSVPVVSAQIVLGGLGQGGGLIAQGSKMFADTFMGATLQMSYRDANLAIRQDASHLIQVRAHAMREMMRTGMTFRETLERSGIEIPQGLDTQYTDQHTPPDVGNKGSIAHRAATRSTAQTAGRLEGLSLNTEGLGGSDQGLINNSLKAFTAAMGRIENQAMAEGQTELAKAAADYRAAQARFHEAKETIGQMHVRGVVLGVIPIPSLDNYGKDTFESNYKMWETTINAERTLQNARIDTLKEYGDAVLRTAGALYGKVKGEPMKHDDFKKLPAADQMKVMEKVKKEMKESPFGVSAGLRVARNVYGTASFVYNIVQWNNSLQSFWDSAKRNMKSDPEHTQENWRIGSMSGPPVSNNLDKAQGRLGDPNP